MIDNAAKRALVVRGGWDGHQPQEATDLFIPFLEASSFTVRVEGSPRVYADADYIVQLRKAPDNVNWDELADDARSRQ